MLIKITPEQALHIDNLRALARAAWAEESEASRKAEAADKVASEALNEASGIMGHVLKFEQRTGYIKDQTKTRRLVVNRVTQARGGLLAHGRSVNSHGEIGTARLSCDVAKADDLGVYVPVAK